MREIRNNENRVICITTPVGSGKSTMVEAITCNILDGDPGPMLITGQTDDDIQDWAETGLWPSLKACEPIKHKLPTERGKWRKMQLVIPRSPIHLTGANMSGLQSKSERWVIGDECWMWKKGLLGELLKRLHRRWNGRAVLLGQAGFVELDENEEPVGDDFSLMHHQGEQREWCFSCPQCGDVQPYELENLQTPDDGTAAERAVQAVYSCGNCQTAWKDGAKERRALNDSSRYETLREAIVPGRLSFHLNALALWRSPWSEVALEYLLAKESEAKGITLPLQQFMQKQMAEPWNEDLTVTRSDVATVEGSCVEFEDGEEKIDGEVIRFATIDVGRDHYWLGIRCWRADGSSVGIYYGRVNTEEMCKRICQSRKVEPNHIYIDSGYDTGRIYDICARYGWVAIKGDDATKYNHRVKGGGSVERLMSPRKMILAPCNKRVPLVHLAVNPLKDILARLRTGQGARWEVLEDIGEDWLKQIDSEEREEFAKAKTNQTGTRWVKRRKANHSWDVEVYQVAAALIWRVFS